MSSAPKKQPLDFKEVTAKLLNEMVVIVQDTKKFIHAQVPDIIKQLLLFEAFEYSMRGMLYVIFIFALVFFSLWSFFVVKTLGFLWLTVSMGGVCGLVFFWAFTLFGSFWGYAIKIGQILIAPKIYLIEFLSEWLKK